MRKLLILGALLLTAGAAHAGRYHWYRVANVKQVTIHVHTVSLPQLAALTAKYNDSSLERACAFADLMCRAVTESGLAVLFRDRNTGQYVCEIYLVYDTPKLLAHEERHCHGWAHKEP